MPHLSIFNCIVSNNIYNSENKVKKITKFVTCPFLGQSDLKRDRLQDVFSPNGDDVNDIITVFAVGMETFNFKVFNTWGVMVYEAEDIEKVEWDGTNLREEHLGSIRKVVGLKKSGINFG